MSHSGDTRRTSMKRTKVKVTTKTSRTNNKLKAEQLNRVIEQNAQSPLRSSLVLSNNSGVSDSGEGGVSLEGASAQPHSAVDTWLDSEHVENPAGFQPVSAQQEQSTHDTRSLQHAALIEKRWSDKYMDVFSTHVRPPFENGDLGRQDLDDISAKLVKALAIMSYWVPIGNVRELMDAQVAARLRDYYHGNKAHHMTPCDVKEILLRLARRPTQGMAGKSWAQLAEEALQGDVSYE
ncbi:hypothetical protein LTR56_018364 [Elasticomyces elasticus]|nr:hypothetical protein LTR56_018364 [Elasticomyces elasticus]KAK3637291.1 hypothetical protein LTR22_018325 [Elasticomyces elasticus]KAK4916437.1 hypothetical protein LTR49_015535 [Elasticomyces elasticus]KAK5756017.1 hypothetical protein LTS12_013906 [Elasticomyces elasticus]